MTVKFLPKLMAVAVTAPMLLIATGAARAEYVCKVKEYLPVHSCPKLSCDQIHKLDHKFVVIILDSVPNWHHIKTSQYDWDGWVQTKYICADDYQGDDAYHEEEGDDGYSSGDSTY